MSVEIDPSRTHVGQVLVAQAIVREDGRAAGVVRPTERTPARRRSRRVEPTEAASADRPPSDGGDAAADHVDVRA